MVVVAFFFQVSRLLLFEVSSNLFSNFGMNYFPAIKVSLQFHLEIFVVGVVLLACLG